MTQIIQAKVTSINGNIVYFQRIQGDAIVNGSFQTEHPELYKVDQQITVSVY